MSDENDAKLLADSEAPEDREVVVTHIELLRARMLARYGLFSDSAPLVREDRKR